MSVARKVTIEVTVHEQQAGNKYHWDEMGSVEFEVSQELFWGPSVASAVAEAARSLLAKEPDRLAKFSNEDLEELTGDAGNAIAAVESQP